MGKLYLLKKNFGKVWALENNEAVPINQKEIEYFTNNLILKINDASESKELARLSFGKNQKKVLQLNEQLVKKIDKNFLNNLLKELKRYSILKYYKIDKKKISGFYVSVVDLFTKPVFLRALRRQMKSKRHLHGLSKGIVKHLWCVALFCYIKSKENKEYLARAGMLHDLTLRCNNYVADLEHQKTAAELAQKMDEPYEVVTAIEDHLFFDMIRLKRLPRTIIARKLVWYDTIISIQDRVFSVLIKIKGLFKNGN